VRAYYHKHVFGCERVRHVLTFRPINPDMLRKMLKTAFQPPAVRKTIEKTRAKMPEELKHPFDDLLVFADELDMNDLDAIVLDFVALCNQFKTKVPKKLAELREKARKEGQAIVSGSSFGSAYNR
jgi:hypothetical protein